MTAEGLGWDSEMQTATAWETQESGAGGRLGDKAAGGGDTRKGTSADANKTGAGGRHGERPELRGRITGWRETLLASPQECGATGGAVRPPEWTTSPWEWGTRKGAVRTPEWQKIHGGTPRE